MRDYIIYQILELRGFILLLLAVMFLFTVFLFFSMGKKKQGMRDFKWQMLFLGLSYREILLLALGISQVCFVSSVILFSSSVGLIQITAIAILCILRGIIGLSPAGFLGEMIYGVLSVAALFIENLLRDYMRETGVELYIGVIWGLLSLFILQYSIYYFVKGVERILQQHEKARGKREQKKAQ